MWCVMAVMSKQRGRLDYLYSCTSVYRFSQVTARIQSVPCSVSLVWISVRFSVEKRVR
jgi:hypothetical protein